MREAHDTGPEMLELQPRAQLGLTASTDIRLTRSRAGDEETGFV